MVFISFPGLGIDEFSLNRVAFSVGRLEVRWYGIIIVLGIITAFLYAHMRSKEFGVSFDDLLDVALYTVIAGIVGARIYYVLSKLDSYTNFWDVFKIWEGGIAIYGAIIGGGLALFIVSRIKKLDIPSMFDAVAPGVMIAQAIGRWGNFFNGEAYGVTPSESSPLYFLRMTVRHENWGSEYLAQPCFLYESIWNLLGFVLINFFYKKKRFNGQIFLEYLIWYGFGRFFIESQRTDSLYIGATDVRKSMLVGAICVIVGLGLLIAGLVKTRKAVLAEGEYADLFPNLNGRGSQKNDGKASAQSEACEEKQDSGERSFDDSDPSETAKDDIQPLQEDNETPDVADSSDSIADNEPEKLRMKRFHPKKQRLKTPHTPKEMTLRLRTKNKDI
ncbi:MAG: prolipoprotein diacylglyceryl transferase [Clostridia bacterium]|nr:prolipoprotein diacylglyceryl transferase [Clostridia bacterium]